MARPWVMHPNRWAVSLYEHLDHRVRHRDPTGHDRLLACGAALETMMIAARALGRETRCELYPDPGQPDEVGRIEVLGRIAPTADDLARYRAIDRIGSPPGALPPVPGTEHGQRCLVVTDGDISKDRVLAGMAQRMAVTVRVAGLSVRLTGGAQRDHGMLGPAQVEVRLRRDTGGDRARSA